MPLSSIACVDSAKFFLAPRAYRPGGAQFRCIPSQIESQQLVKSSLNFNFNNVNFRQMPLLL